MVTDEEAQVSLGSHLCCYSTGRTDRSRAQPLGCMTSGTRIWPDWSDQLPQSSWVWVFFFLHVGTASSCILWVYDLLVLGQQKWVKHGFSDSYGDHAAAGMNVFKAVATRMSLTFSMRLGRENCFMFHLILFLVPEVVGDVRQLSSTMCAWCKTKSGFFFHVCALGHAYLRHLPDEKEHK